MDQTSLISLFSFAIVVAFTPGPNNVLLAASGANFGFWRTLPHISGVVAGFCFMVIATGFGLGALFDAVPAVHDVMKILSIMFLLYLAWRIATAVRVADVENARPLSFMPATMFQLVNPKGLSFLISVMSVYTDSDASMVEQLIPIFVILSFTTITSAIGWCLFGKIIGRFLKSDRKLRFFNVIMGLLLVATILPILRG